MIDVIVWVIRAVEAPVEVAPDPDLVVPVEPLPAGRLPPPGVGAVVSGVGTVVVVVGASHGIVVVVDGGVAATVVVDCGVVEVVDVVEVVEVVEAVVADDESGVGVVAGDESGTGVVVAVSTGIVAAVVVVVVGAGVVVVGQPIRAARAVEGTDEAALPVELVDRDDVLAELDGTTLELV